jgi:hypothetical protein
MVFAFHLALECTVRSVQENLEGLYCNVTHQCLVYADDNLLSECA